MRKPPSDDDTESPKSEPDAESQMVALLRTIEGEIIPRLLLSHLGAPASNTPPRHDGTVTAKFESEDVTEFARLVVSHDVTIAKAYIQALQARGIPLERVYLDLLAPAARLLGDGWKDDSRDFTEVTIGLSRLHQLLREFSPTFLREAQPTESFRRVLLLPLIGEQHTFGLILLGEFFRRAGWDVWDLYPQSVGELLRLVRAERFTVIGISLSCETRLDELPPLIQDVRLASRNPRVGVMVGGPPFVGRPDLVTRIGADATADSGERAAWEAERLVEAITRRV